jgi:rod shape-determining protein MreD
MTAAIMAVLLLVAGLLQDLIAGPLWLGQVKAPLLLAVALYYALYYERIPMLVAAVLAGIVQDSISLMPIGYSSFCFCLLGLAVQKSRGVLFKGSLETAALLGGISGALAIGFLQCMLVMGTEYASGPWWWAVWRMVGSGLLGLVAFPVTWWVAQRLDQLVGNVEPQEA